MVAFAFGAMAAEQKAAPAPAKAAPAPAKAAPAPAKAAPAPAKPAPAPKMEKFSGAIASVNAIAKTFDVKKMVTVKGKKEEKVMTFATDDKTKITKGKEVKAFADLKAGMDVSVAYNKMADKNLATAVKIATPKAAPKPAAPKPAPKK
jgi:2-oxoglutarate dehydrogenase E2 component (dihydrolipoamide succinyltransferase)